MTNDELDRLADAIAQALQRAARDGAAPPWILPPVRPEPPGPPGEPPVWSGAGQRLGDIAPVRQPAPSTYRDDLGTATRSIRAAAAGHGVVRQQRSGGRSDAIPAPRSRPRGGAMVVPVGVSNRHVHLSEADALALFGTGLTSHRALTQPGQFAADQRVAVVGSQGRIDGVRVVGPARGTTQLELAYSDAARLGVTAPVANSGQLEGSAGGVVLEGTHGRVTLGRGVIVAARHLHLSTEDARRWRLADGDTATIRCGIGGRETTWHSVLVRSGDGHATEFHLDVDEAHAAGVTTGDSAVVCATATPARGRRPVVTERDVIAIAARGGTMPADAILTPSARDRARALGMLRP